MDSDWIDGEEVARTAKEALIREQPVPLPSRQQFRDFGIHLENQDKVMVFELCRYLAATHREQLLATPDELRGNISPQVTQILQLDEWNHPNVVDVSCRPGNSETFQQLAAVLVSGDIHKYQPIAPPNTHWRNWPDGGTL